MTFRSSATAAVRLALFCVPNTGSAMTFRSSATAAVRLEWSSSITTSGSESMFTSEIAIRASIGDGRFRTCWGCLLNGHSSALCFQARLGWLSRLCVTVRRLC
ncbi:hypothetical protein PF004_g11828 [Phytophthora fragariae]|uniref:Secreted protein n=1 Tax=Phytophthora fragariae TaxID=53985 RepID=A0A6G0NWT4_9STRA|nr:hypothetical protein PF004_g11828 [Phytophthora fragariae]